MPDRIQTAWSTIAVPGDHYPQCAVHDGVPWFLWASPVSGDGIRLEGSTAPDRDSTEIILAKRNGAMVQRVCAFADSGDFAQPLDLCVSSHGPVALWKSHQGGSSRLMAGTENGASTALCSGERIWDAQLVALADGTIVLATIRLQGKIPQLQFYRFAQNGVPRIAPLEGMVVDGAWSVALAPLDAERFWIALDSYVADRFQVAIGTAVPDQRSLSLQPLPGTGFATDPHVIPLPGRQACVAWAEDKAWGAHEYDFKRKTRLKLAQVDAESVVFCEDVPVPTGSWDDDEQQMPCSPAVVALEDGLHVFFRRPRAVLQRGARVNDWGWQIWECVRDPEGRWHEPGIFSHDVSTAEDPMQAVRVSARQAALIYHSCSYDQRRTYVHSHRIHLAVYSAGAAGPPAAPVEYPAIARETRPRLAQRPQTRVDGATLQCYWGDLHRHSLVSKCIPEHDGSYRDHFRYALGSRGFDFYSITDHIETQITGFEWGQLLALSDVANKDGSFAAIYGFEGPNDLVKGHLNYYFLDREAAEFGFRELRCMDSLSEVEQACRERGLHGRVLCIRHFHADGLAHQDIVDGTTALSPELDWAIEVVQGRGYSPKATHALLAAGFRFGFIGSTDHNRPPGHPNGGIGIYEQAIAGIWAQQISREHLFAALRDRRCFASNGARLAACLRVNGKFMGGVAEARAQNTIEVEIVPTTELTETRLIRDGETVGTSYSCSSEPVRLRFTDEPSATAEHYYYAQIIQAPEPGLAYPGIAWTTPVWVTAAGAGR